MIDSVFRAGKSYYPQVFFKEKKMPECITYNIEISSDSDREDFDEESSNEE